MKTITGAAFALLSVLGVYETVVVPAAEAVEQSLTFQLIQEDQ